MKSATALRRVRLAAEVVLIFYGLPLLYVVLRWPPFVFGLLWPSAAIALTVLLRDPSFDRRRLGRIGRVRRELVDVTLLFLLSLAGMALIVAWLSTGQFFNMPRRYPGLWAAVILLYPMLSVYPQEVIWRALFFHRYAPLFGGGGKMVVASALAFAWVHVIMLNPLALLLSVPGGLIFARRYWRTESLLATGLEHSLYGIAVFTIGLGVYFVTPR